MILPEVIVHPLGFMHVFAFGLWTPAPQNSSFCRVSRACPEFLTRGRPHRMTPLDVHRRSGPKTLSLGCIWVPEKCSPSCEDRQKSRRKTEKSRCALWRSVERIATLPHSQNRSLFGTLRSWSLSSLHPFCYRPFPECLCQTT